MHSRSIEFAKKFSVPIHVRSSFSDQPGTMIVAEPESPSVPVCGAALTRDEARISIAGVPDRPGVSAEIFSKIAACNVTIDMIVQNIGYEDKANISFTVPAHELKITLEAVHEAVASLGPVEVTHNDQVAKVSVVGLGMATQAGVADKLFLALANEGMNVQMITTSEIKISVLIDRQYSAKALAVVHRAFGLDRVPTDAARPKVSYAVSRSPAELTDILSRLGSVDMEELFLDGIALDEGQALVSIDDVPDTPGIAGRIFEAVANAGILVDMIVQSDSLRGRANLSFTVPRSQLPEGVAAVRSLAGQLGCGRVSTKPEISKLSVSGIGLRSHTIVAIRMFQALGDVGVNVEMISTSEVRVNVVVDGKMGQKSLDCLESAFADVLR